MSNEFVFSNSYYEAIKNLQKLFNKQNEEFRKSILPVIEFTNYYQKQIQQMQKLIKINMPKFNLMNNSIRNLQSSIATSIEPIISQQMQFNNLSKYYFKSISKSIMNLEINDDVDINQISEEEKVETISDFENIELEQNWQQRINAIIQKWKTKNPIVAGVIIFILLTLMSKAIETWGEYVYETTKSVCIHEQPKKESETIIQLTKSIEIKIIADVPYYYQIECENGKEIITGWVSKRSVKQKDIK